MSHEINLILNSLEQTKEFLEMAWDKANEVSSLGNELGGEWEQEIASDMDTLQIKVRDMIDNILDIIEEGKTLFEDWKEQETNLRLVNDDEELNKFEDEDLQERIKEHQWQEDKKRRK
jgi:hypothetical protein